MKLLILLVFCTTNFAFSADEVEVDLNKQFVTVIKDRENETKLNDSIEFKQCREEIAKKKSGDIADAAASCLTSKISTKSVKDLEALSSNLNLTDYKLISSNNVKEISKYLSDKLYKSMTGIDPNEKDPKKLSFRNKDRKMIDQRDIISLYKSQVGKNALLAISNYCYKDLRLKSDKGGDETLKTFGSYWRTEFSGPAIFLEGRTNDLGVPVFTGSSSSSKDPYSDMMNSLDLSKEDLKNDSNKNSALSKFFTQCFSQINNLCKNLDTATGSGAKSCTLKAQIANYRKTIIAIDKILNDKEFQTTGKSSLVTDLVAGGSISGNMDDLTSITSSDILNGGKSNNSKAEECAKRPETAGCEGFLGNSGANDEIYENAEINTAFRKEVEQAKIKAMKGDKEKLAEYLENNGYLNLTASSSEQEILDEINKRFDAQVISTQSAMKDVLGSRQSKDDIKNSNTSDKERIKENAEKSVTERARLAQVVLFNNIITSQLSLQKKGEKESLGRNVNPLKKELAAASNSGKVDSDLFQGLQTSVTENSAGSKVTGNEDLASISFLDSILGKKED